jgi:membrane-associated protease RseP (regulator of RpoE activity)
MSQADPAPDHDGPPPAALLPAFRVTGVETTDDGELRYYGQPRTEYRRLEQQLWPLFRQYGYEVRLDVVEDADPDPITGVDVPRTRQALVATPRSVGVDGVPWTNVATFVATVLTTLYAGTVWYYQPVDSPLDLLAGWPFALAVLGVLGVHELGHYVLSRYHDVEASLPYFIPVPTYIGTFGAVIKMKGRIPNRKALFDIGVAGPLAGLAAAVVVALVGLQLDPVAVPETVLRSENAVRIELGYPPLLQFLAWASGERLTYADPTVAASPVIFGAWVGLFVTFLNLIPVGQLDGGHITRAMVGERARTAAALVPAALFSLAGYLYLFRDVSVNAPFLWTFWGLVAMGLAYVGPTTPIFDDPLDGKRKALGVLTFLLGLGCFTPVPIEVLSA